MRNAHVCTAIAWTFVAITSSNRRALLQLESELGDASVETLTHYAGQMAQLHSQLDFPTPTASMTATELAAALRMSRRTR